MKSIQSEFEKHHIFYRYHGVDSGISSGGFTEVLCTKVE